MTSPKKSTAKKPAAKKTVKAAAGVTQASEWKKQRGIELELPSGNVCLVKRPGITELIAEGVFPDSILGIITSAIDTADKGPKRPSDRKPKAGTEDDAMGKAMSEIVADPEKLRAMLASMDDIALMCILEPKVLSAKDDSGEPIPFADRDDELLYIDEVDEEDKMFIFNFTVGGDTDLERFREETGLTLGDVSNLQDVGVSSE